MSIGIKNVFRTTAAQVVTSSTALVTATGMTIPIAANQEIHIRYHLVFTVGATGGIRFQITVPAAPTFFNNDILLVNTVAPSTSSANQTAQAAFTNALANAGNHFVEGEFHIVNGATAGNVTIQFAQNTSDVLSATLVRGSWMETCSL
jgi:hypothetical protein